MKHIAVIISLLYISSHAQAADTKDLIGAWHEVVRTRDGQRISIRDTLFFEVLSNNQCIWGKSRPNATRLRLRQIGTTIIIGPYEYDIVAQEGNWMKLAADEGIEIEMLRYHTQPPPLPPPAPSHIAAKKMLATTNPSPTFKPGPTPKMGTVPSTVAALEGIWTCYRRSTNKPITPALKYRVLRMLAVEDYNDYLTAKLYGFDDLDGAPSWVAENYEAGTLYCSGTDERNFKVINCQANELVIENEGIVYYMRKVQR